MTPAWLFSEVVSQSIPGWFFEEVQQFIISQRQSYLSSGIRLPMLTFLKFFLLLTYLRIRITNILNYLYSINDGSYNILVLRLIRSTKEQWSYNQTAGMTFMWTLGEWGSRSWLLEVMMQITYWQPMRGVTYHPHAAMPRARVVWFRSCVKNIWVQIIPRLTKHVYSA